MTLPPLKALRAFEAAARLMSFKAAADELALTPTAISHQIRLLENVLQRQLFRRRPRPLALTPAGAALFPVLRSSFETIAEACTKVCGEIARVPPRVAPGVAGAFATGGDLAGEGDGPQQAGTALSGAPSPPPRLSIVVLPFGNIGGDHDQEYFADGITESLTTCRASRARSSSPGTLPSLTGAGRWT
jgi:regulatory helix-turn-helix LysR family protein